MATSPQIVITWADAESGHRHVCTLDEFVQQNADLDDMTSDVVAHIERGETYQGGGGAQPLFTVALAVLPVGAKVVDRDGFKGVIRDITHYNGSHWYDVRFSSGVAVRWRDDLTVEGR